MNGGESSPGAAELIAVVSRLRRALRGLRRREWRGGVLPDAQFDLLRAVSREPGQRVQDIAAELNVAGNTVSTLAGQLEGKGLICRRQDEADGRGMRLHPTEEAAAFLEGVRDQREAAVAAALAELSGEEKEVIGRALPALERLRRLIALRSSEAAGGGAGQPPER